MYQIKTKKVIGLLAVVLATSACSQKSFRLIDPSRKRDYLRGHFVLNDKVRLAAGSAETIGATGDGTSSGSQETLPAPTPAPQPPFVNQLPQGTTLEEFCKTFPQLCTNGQLNVAAAQLSSLPTSNLTGGGISTIPQDPILIFELVDWVNQANQNGAQIPINITDPGQRPDKPPQGTIGTLPISSLDVGTTVTIEDPSISVQYLCSNRRSDRVGGNVKTLTSDYTIRLRDMKTQAVLCERTGPEIREGLLNEKKLKLPANCAGLGSKPLSIELVVDGSKHLLFGSGYYANGIFVSNQEQVMMNYRTGRAALFVLYDVNEGGATEATDACDNRSSPLFIDMAGRNGRTELTPITKGVKFNILGERSYPQRHAKKQISWFADPNYMFLVKPNQQGQVLGVDEMFGNNTMGPDGLFAKHGFHALAKLDDNRDGMINSEDRVFAQLRLWSDINHDGLAAPGELFMLDFMGVELIDLGFDRNYYELDKYGNEIMFKSVVKMKDDSLRLMFDVWFRYL